MTIKILTPKQLESRITAITKAGKKLQEDIHQACVSALVHVLEHGDVRPLNKLCDVTGKIVHQNAVRRWFNQHSKNIITWDNKAKAFSVNSEKRNAIREDADKASAFIETITDETKAKPYYTMAEGDKDPTAFDFMKRLESLIKQAERRKNHETKTYTDQDNFEMLEAAKAWFESNKFGEHTVQ